MTSGKEELKNPKPIIGYIEKEEKDEFKKICSREDNSVSEQTRIALREYIKNHKSGNTTYTLDDYGKHKNMLAIPALMSNKESLSKYVQEEQDYTELQKVLDQVEFLGSIIRTKMLNTRRKSPDSMKAEIDRNNRFRRLNDIRYRDPKTLKLHELGVYNEIMSHYTEEQKAEFLKEAQK